MLRVGGTAIGAVAVVANPVCASELSEIVGTWKTVRHGAEVRIADCGNGSPCGTLVAFGPDMADGHTQDDRNPDRSLRSRPLQGLPILWGYTAEEEGWRGGRLYNPETGQVFRSSLTLLSETDLKVRGCLGPLCRSQIWTRISHKTANVGED